MIAFSAVAGTKRFKTSFFLGPDNTQRSSFDQQWSSDLRPDNADDRLPAAWQGVEVADHR